jgi:hypothetical protein
MKSIIDNNLNYSILSYFLQDMIDFELHKMKFNETLYVLNIIKDEMSNVNNILLKNVKVVDKDELVYDIEDNEKYSFIFIKYLYYKNFRVYEGTRFIQELSEIEFDMYQTKNEG